MLSKELLSEVLGLDVYEDDKKFSELLKINSISDNVNYNIRFLKDKVTTDEKTLHYYL